MTVLGSVPPRSILGGGYAVPRQMMTQQGQPQPMQASPFAMPAEAGPPAYGSDAWAAQKGGPGAMIWREMARAMSGGKGGPLGFLDPKTKAFSPELRALLGPQFQKQGK